MSTDVTVDVAYLINLEGQLAAINRSQAVIEFALDGTILTANDNFCNVLGYSLEEIRGRHHSMFVQARYRQSAAYRQFWEKLGGGQHDAGQYLRIGKHRREVWLQASYSPIHDRDGKAVKVVTYATDITTQRNNVVEVERILCEAIRVISAMSSGDVSQQIEGNFSGDNSRLQHTVNGSIARLRRSSNARAVAAGKRDRALAEASRVMSALAEGDLTQQVTGNYGGEFVALKEAVNRSVGNLLDTVSQVRSVSTSISSVAGEISQGNTDLSQRTEEQASSLEETAASLAQLTSTVRQSADNAREASQLATSARDQATRGGDVLRSCVIAMGAINESSRKIADIIGVLDEIAFQTNLLALNAAVEAARAGEQGRGFAVVASEVRNLAQRSAGAAKEIKALINDSVRKVDEGSKLVNASGTTLGEIMGAVKRITDIISEIAAASTEQSSGIEQVNKAIGQMDQVTQQNAAFVEQAAAAADSLDDQARALLESMACFRTGDAMQSRCM